MDEAKKPRYLKVNSIPKLRMRQMAIHAFLCAFVLSGVICKPVM